MYFNSVIGLTIRMFRFSSDWADQASLKAMQKAVFRNKNRILKCIDQCQGLLQTVERVHRYTRRIFSVLADMEDQIYTKIRRGKRTVKIRGP